MSLRRASSSEATDQDSPLMHARTNIHACIQLFCCTYKKDLVCFEAPTWLGQVQSRLPPVELKWRNAFRYNWNVSALKCLLKRNLASQDVWSDPSDCHSEPKWCKDDGTLLKSLSEFCFVLYALFGQNFVRDYYATRMCLCYGPNMTLEWLTFVVRILEVST